VNELMAKAGSSSSSSAGTLLSTVQKVFVHMDRARLYNSSSNKVVLCAGTLQRMQDAALPICVQGFYISCCCCCCCCQDVADAIQQMHEKGRYRELLLVVETCQAATLYSKIT
jgi:hypothetical protein